MWHAPATVNNLRTSLLSTILKYNSFLNPIHSGLYIIAMACLGFHLAHGVQSLIQTFGFNDEKYTPMLHKISNFFGIAIAVGFSSIPVYVLMRGHLC